MRLSILLVTLVAIGCGGNEDQPDNVVRRYLQSEDAAACRFLTAPQAKLCRLPRVPDPGADRVMIERVRIDGDRASVRGSYDWTGYRRHSAFALVRRDGNWLIAHETPEE